MTACPACQAAIVPAQKFCGECGARLVVQPAAVPASTVAVATIAAVQRVSRRQMTVLFCDLVGSTELAHELDPEDLLAALAGYHAMVKAVAVRFDGFVARIVGDGVDLYFGYPMAGEDDAVRAVHAGLALVDAVKGLADIRGRGLALRVGIATGLVAVGLEEAISIAGTTPNLAARIQAITPPGEVAIGPSTRRIAGAQFSYRDLGMFELKGFKEAVRVALVTDASALDSRSAWRGRDGGAPMVGRDAELATLKGAWDRAVAGANTGVLVTAEPGFGKSRLVAVLEHVVADVVHTTVRLQCSPFHVNSALQPFVQHLARAAGFGRQDSSLIQIEKLEAQLAIAGIDDDFDVALIASLLGLESGDRYPPLALAPPAQLQMTKEALIRYFSGLSGRKAALPTHRALSRYVIGLSEANPLLLVFEDLHWIDPTSLEVVALILANPGPSRILLAMTARPEFQPAFEREPTIIRLARLDEVASRAIAVGIATEVALLPAAIDTIIARTDGVPLYIEEMTRMVVESRHDAAGNVAFGGGRSAIPDTLMDLLMERLDRLGPAKWLAQVGSVIGREFGRGLLSAAADMKTDGFDEALATMLAAGLVLPLDATGERFGFKHALIEETAYGSILHKSLVVLHGRVADILLRDFARTVDRQPELAARHLSRARRALEASQWWLRAGRQALGRGAPREAAAHLADGVAVVADAPAGPEQAQSELALLSMLGPTNMILYGPGSAAFGDVQKRAFELCSALPGMPGQFPITYGLCLYHWGRAELQTARRLALDLLAAANARIDDDEPSMAANNIAGMVRFHLGEPLAARDHLARSIARYEPQRDAALYPVYMMDFGVFGRFYLALATFVAGDRDGAQRHALDAYELAGRLSQPHTLGFSMLANFVVAQWRDEPDIARRYADQCIEFSATMGFPEFIAMARVVRGWAIAREGQAASGLEDVDAGIALWQATGFENWQSWFASIRVEILATLGRHAEALDEIALQLERIGRNGEAQFHSLLLADRATILAASPASAHLASAEFDRAEALARAQGALAWLQLIERRRAAA